MSDELTDEQLDEWAGEVHNAKLGGYLCTEIKTSEALLLIAELRELRKLRAEVETILRTIAATLLNRYFPKGEGK